MPPRKAPGTAKKPDKVEEVLLLDPQAILAALAVNEGAGELPTNLLPSVMALLRQAAPPSTAPSADTKPPPTVGRPARSTRTPTSAPSSTRSKKVEEVAPPTPPPTPPAPKQETIRFGMQLVNALLAVLASALTMPVVKEWIPVLSEMGRAALEVLRRGLKEDERVGVEKACVGLAGRLGGLGAKEAALGFLKESRPFILELYGYDSLPSGPARKTPASTIPQTPARRRIPTSTSVGSSSKASPAPTSPPLQPLPAPKDYASLPPATGNLLLSFSAALLSLVPLHPQSSVILTTIHQLALSIPPTTLPSLLMPAVRALSSPPASPLSTPLSIFTSRTNALNLLQHICTLKPSVYWDQLVRFVKSFLGKCSPGQDEYALVSAEVRKRVDWAGKKGVEWRQGIVWDEIVQVWRMVASKAGEVETLDEIVKLLAGESDAAPDEEILVHHMEALELRDDSATPTSAARRQLVKKENAVNVPRALTILSQVALKLETHLNSPSESYDPATDVPQIRSILSSLTSSSSTVDLTVVARSVERVRKLSSKVFEAAADGPLRSAIKGVLEDWVKFAESAIECTTEANDALTATVCDLAFSSTDTLLLLARTIFLPATRQTHPTCLAYLDRAYRLVSSPLLLSEDRAKLKRFISGTAYHFGGKIYKEGRPVNGLDLLRVGCIVAQEAVADWKARLVASEHDGAVTEGKDDQWRTLEEDLGKRWELLGTILLKKDNKKGAYDAFAAGLLSLPSSLFETLSAHSVTKSPTAVFDLQAPPTSIFFSLLNRLTIVGHFDLGLPSAKISARSLLSAEGRTVVDGAVGLALEYQLQVLGAAYGKDGIARLAGDLLSDAEAIYTTELHPVRRLRVISEKIRLLASNSSEDTTTVDELASEVERCATSQSFGQDNFLISSIPAHVGLANLWLAMLSRAAGSTTSQVVHHALKGVRHLRIAYPKLDVAGEKDKVRTPVRTTALKESARQPVPPPVTVRKRAVRGAATPKLSSPKAPSRTSRTKTTLVDAPTTAISSVPVEGLDVILNLLDTTSSTLGFLGETCSKIQVLKMIRSLTLNNPRYLDSHLNAVGMLGEEYVKISKISRAAHVFDAGLATLHKPRQGFVVSPAAEAVFLLRYSMYLALEGGVEQSLIFYRDALQASSNVQYDSKLVGSARLKEKTFRIERAALAHEVAAVIYHLQNDLTLSIASLSQAHRLWNSAVKNVSRLTPRPTVTKAASPISDNPFTVESTSSSLPPSEQPPKDAVEATKKEPLTIERRLNSMGARASEGLLNCLLSFSTALTQRGSPREAELYLQQLVDLASNGGSPTMAGRALSRRAVINLQMGKADEAATLIEEARKLLPQDQYLDLAHLLSTEGSILEICEELGDAQASYDAALLLLNTAEAAFELRDLMHPVLPSVEAPEPIYFPLLAGLLRQKALVLLGLSAQDGGVNKRLSGRHIPCSTTPATLSEDLSHDAQQVLRSALEDFKSDLTLSSLTESSISIPMGYVVGSGTKLSKARKDAITALDRAEAAFCKALEHNRACGRVQQVREACISLGLLRALQTSMGQDAGPLALKTAGSLDHCSAITLRREFLEAIINKTPRRLDDLAWPFAPKQLPSRASVDLPIELDSDTEDDAPATNVWDLISSRQKDVAYDQDFTRLPADCCVITITVSDDLTTLFISRRSAEEEPIVFSLPLDRQGRREGEDEHFSFADAVDELAEIIGASNETARNAKEVDSKQGKVDWWAERRSLDKRMEELLNNIEFCWLGAFKSIFNQPSLAGPRSLATFKTKLEDLFGRALSSSRKSGPQIRIDDNLLGCFATLKSTSRDEELEDLVYFILDLYQVHGQAVALAEVDVDQLVIDIRTILEDQEHQSPDPNLPPVKERNIYLVLDRHCQPIPWESLPTLREQSITRIPSTPFLEDRVLLSQHGQESSANIDVEAEDASDESVALRPTFDHKNGLYILNPSGDLVRTQKTLEPWTEKMDAIGWTGIVGRVPSEEEMVNALQTKDIVVYFGHGGAEQYIQSRKIRHLRRCATVMLWGCSSGHLKDQGEYDRTGVPWHYMVAGCPSLVANLWDVTDRDIDRLSSAVLSSMHLDGGEREVEGGLSTAQAVAKARTECKLRFLTGAAPVVYGVPSWAA